jgi:hypothetical protein
VAFGDGLLPVTPLPEDFGQHGPRLQPTAPDRLVPEVRVPVRDSLGEGPLTRCHRVASMGERLGGSVSHLSEQQVRDDAVGVEPQRLGHAATQCREGSLVASGQHQVFGPFAVAHHVVGAGHRGQRIRGRGLRAMRGHGRWIGVRIR